MRIVYGILVAAVIFANFLLRPPTYQRANNEKYPLQARIDGGERQVEALLVWQQNSFNIWNIFFFFPTNRELLFYNSEHRIRWSIKEQYKAEFENQYQQNFTIPLWKYYLGSITLVFLSVVYGLHRTSKALWKDHQKWINAKRDDSFLSYKTYLLEKRRLKLHNSSARKLMQAKVNEYKKFYSFLTAQHPGPGKQVLLEILDTIARTGRLEVGISYRFRNCIVEHKDKNRQEIMKIQDYLTRIRNNPSISNTDREKALSYLNLMRTQMNFDITEVGPHFQENQNKSREQIITKLIDRVFARIFPEQIVTFSYNAKDTDVRFEVEYTVSTTDSLYSKRSEDHLHDNQKNFFTGVEFAWKLEVHSNGSTLLSHQFKSQPATTFTTGSNRSGDVYKAMAMSAFVNFGKELLKYFGIQSTSTAAAGEAVISTATRQSWQQELFKKFQEEVRDQMKVNVEEWVSGQMEKFLKQYEKDISHMINSVTSELEQMMTVYVGGLAKGVDMGEMGAEAISSIFDR